MPPRSGGYAQKTTLVGIRASDDEDPQGLKPFITNLGQSIILGNDRPQGGRAHPHHCFLILADVSAGGARQLIGCAGSVYFRVSGDAKPYYPNNHDAHPSGSRDLRATMTTCYCI